MRNNSSSLLRAFSESRLRWHSYWSCRPNCAKTKVKIKFLFYCIRKWKQTGVKAAHVYWWTMHADNWRTRPYFVCLPQFLSLGHLKVINVLSKILRQGTNNVEFCFEGQESIRRKAVPVGLFICVKFEPINPHRARAVDTSGKENSHCLMITSILYPPSVCVGHIPTGFLVIDIQYILYQIHLRF